MKRCLALLILGCVLGVTVAAAAPDLEWIPVTDARFQIDGLPFFAENEGRLWRFPVRAEGVVPKAVWGLAKSPSGGRIRFNSDTTALAIRVKYDTLPGMRNMHAYGQAGIDAYLDGQYIRSVVPRKSTEVESFFFENLISRDREITLYLPLYLGVTVEAVGVVKGAVIQAPKDYAVERPVVFYGTSITQGGCASRSGMSYQAILGRRLNLDFVNFGFSGAGKGEKEVAELIREVTASCYVMDMAQNNRNAEELEAVYLPFLKILRERHPETPMLCTTPIYASSELPGSRNQGIYPELSGLEEMRQVIRRAVNARVAAGDENIRLVEGYSLLGPHQGDGLVDGAHPNDLGFQGMADGLEPHLRGMLGLP